MSKVFEYYKVLRITPGIQLVECNIVVFVFIVRYVSPTII